MPPWRPALDHWFQTHLGVISTSQLTGLGCSTRTVHRMVARGELVVARHGVYRSSQFPVSREQQLVALCASNPNLLIAFTSAGLLWGCRKIVDHRLHVLAPHGVSPELSGVVVHRCRRIDPVDIVERPDGIRLTSPPRTLFDSADMLGLSAARSVLEQMLHERRFTFGTMVDTYQRLAHPNRPGSRTMLDVITSRPKWRTALQSDLELRVLEEFERQGLPPAVTQCPVHLPTGRTIHLDFGWPQWKVGVEVDDPAWHAGSEERHRDAHRDRKATTVGWNVPRITKIDVNGALADAVSDVAIILHRRGFMS